MCYLFNYTLDSESVYIYGLPYKCSLSASLIGKGKYNYPFPIKYITERYLSLTKYPNNDSKELIRMHANRLWKFKGVRAMVLF